MSSHLPKDIRERRCGTCDGFSRDAIFGVCTKLIMRVGRMTDASLCKLWAPKKEQPHD
jgi:hypothetical protein